MLLSQTLQHYKREDIRTAMVFFAANKELGVRYTDSFGKRPDVLNYPGDVLEFAKNRATSFHISEESWKNPLLLSSDLSRRQLDDLRTGWDLVLDIDCPVFEYSKISAYYTIKALWHHGIKSVSCKFSGNKGFHIGVPFESFPEKIGGIETRILFPEAPKKIAEYIKFLIKDPVSEAIIRLEKGSFQEVIRKTGIQAEKIVRKTTDDQGQTILRLDSDHFLAIDTILISSRHMYRMPYSLHEKSGLVSVPIDINNVLAFSREQAQPKNVVVTTKYMDRGSALKGEAAKLIIQAFDFAKPKETSEETPHEYEDLLGTEAVPESFFPPCINNISAGIKDGKKRALFILRNFLDCCGWEKDKIKDYVYAWNKRNPEQLRETIVKGQLRYAQAKKVPPPNCDNTAYYKDFGVCTPDNFCRRIKNPCQYAKLKTVLTRKNKKIRKKTAAKQTGEPMPAPAQNTQNARTYF